MGRRGFARLPVGLDVVGRSCARIGISVRGVILTVNPVYQTPAARRAIRYILRRFDVVDAILLIRDIGRSEMSGDGGLEQATS